MRYTREFAENYDYSILYEPWEGMERGTDEWCLQQAGLLLQDDRDQLLVEGKIDIKGIAAFILDMSSDHMIEALDYSAEKMRYLLELKYSTTNKLKPNCKKKIIKYTRRLQVLFCRTDRITSNMDLINNDADEIIEESYFRAIEAYRLDAKHSVYLQKGLSKIPEVCPWTLEGLIEKNSKELLKFLG